MDTKIKAQFSFDDLYVTPFTRRRGFDEKTLRNIWVPLPDSRRRTGINLLDTVVDLIIAGHNPMEAARQFGLTRAQLSTVVLALTGMRPQQLELQWRARRVGELLRYTNLSFAAVMEHCGMVSAPSFSRFVHDCYGVSPKLFRRTLRQPGELGMYAL